MKVRVFSVLTLLLLPVLGLTVGLGAKSADASKKAGAAKNKMPALKVDASPVGEGVGPGVLTSYADVLDAIRPAVVSVYSKTTVRQPTFGRLGPLLVPGPDIERQQKGVGSGVVVSSDGYILTNNHVVTDADQLEVALNDERKFPAKLIGKDPKTDVAVIKIEADNLPAATLADSDKLRVGDVVFAIGNPLDVGQTVTMGIVSATGRRVGILDDVAGYENFIQTDAAINQGNSGGALIDAKGRVVGINSAILSNSQGNIGIGFAIPIKLASSIMKSLVEQGKVARGLLGVYTDVLPPDLAESFGLKPDTKGVVITDLKPSDGPAAKAGLKPEDVIVAINDKPVASRDDLRLMIAETSPGTKITVKFMRAGKPQTAEITLGQASDDGGSATEGEWIEGVSVSPLTNDLRRQLRVGDNVDGIVIMEVSARSPYRDLIPTGAVIVQINRVPITDLAGARHALHEGRNLAYIYYRGVFRFMRIDVP